MASPLDSFRALCKTPAEAARWACVLEATAPKAGNVFPGQPFDDLSHEHFVVAASVVADAFADSSISTAQRALFAAKNTFKRTGTNVNLGILLLLTPLVAADETGNIHSREDWSGEVCEYLSRLPRSDSVALFDAIGAVGAGGLGKVEQMDVHSPERSPSDIVAAMRLAVGRDRIARQYADSFRDLIDNVVPVVDNAIGRASDVLLGIADAHLQLLAAEPDTLIERKCGPDVAREVQQRASQVDLDDMESRRAFDDFLRSRNNQLNPGTTADLIAAALYVLLRNPLI